MGKVAQIIERMGRTKYAETEPERQTQKILDELGRSYLVGMIDNPLNVRCDDGKITLHPDFILTDIKGEPVILVQGPHHDTPKERRKDEWRARLYNGIEKRVIFVDWRLLNNKENRTYLKDALVEAINSQEKVVRIDA